MKMKIRMNFAHIKCLVAYGNYFVKHLYGSRFCHIEHFIADYFKERGNITWEIREFAKALSGNSSKFTSEISK